MSLPDTSGSDTAHHRVGPGWRHACALADLAEGGMRRVNARPPIALALLDGTVHAFEDRCPHAGALLSRGLLVDGGVECPLHGARFRLDNGRVLCPPARRDLRTYDVVVHRGEVYVRDRPRRRRRRTRPRGTAGVRGRRDRRGRLRRALHDLMARYLHTD